MVAAVVEAARVERMAATADSAAAEAARSNPTRV